MNDNDSSPLWHGLDLTAALRILKNAGKPDPTSSGGDLPVQLQALIDALCDVSQHDGLTGLVNARFFHAVLASEIDRSSRTGRTLGLLMLDIDHFKEFNDRYGHPAGNMVLQQVAHQLKRSLRSMDTPARVGGDEFAAILPECESMDAVSAALRIHGLLNPLRVNYGGNVFSVTTSAGLVWTEPQGIVTVEQLITQADCQMYRAKQTGRSSLCYPSLITTQVSADERAALAASAKGATV